MTSAHSTLNGDQKVKFSDIISKFKLSLWNIEKLKKEFEHVQNQKRRKLEQVERISSNLIAGVKEKDELIQSLKVEREKNKEMLRPCSSSRNFKRQVVQGY